MTATDPGRVLWRYHCDNVPGYDDPEISLPEGSIPIGMPKLASKGWLVFWWERVLDE